MKKRNTFKKTTVLALCASFALGSAAGCGLITTDNEKDMAQVIGTVDITSSEDFRDGGAYAAYADVVKTANSTILKRDLVAYFLNVGYTYVQSYGYTYEQTFTTLMNTLVSRKIMVQYAMAYYFAEAGDTYTVSGCDAYVTAQKEAIADETEKKLIADHPEILTMKYFLTEGGQTGAEHTADYDKAVYGLKTSVNSTLDSAEESYISKEDDSSTSDEEARTLPTNAGTEAEDYYTTDYEIYTGLNTPDSCGEYERQDGSTQTTRLNAYRTFLANLTTNGLLGETEDTTDFTKTNYYYIELASQMEQALITRLSEDLSEEANESLNKEYVEAKYQSLLDYQTETYSADQDSFNTAIGSLSDTSFVVYSPEVNNVDGYKFGFVYNILLPFSKTQEQVLSAYTNNAALTQSQKYAARAQLLDNVQGKDLRGTWFSSDEDANYAYEAATDADYYKNGSSSSYLFFEDNLAKSGGDNPQYEELGQYYGRYPYNGTVTVDEDGEYTVKPNKLSVDEFLTEMEGYLAYAGLTASGAKASSYVTDGNYTLDEKTGEFDYSEFLYYEGKVQLNDTAHKDYFVKDTDAYKAVSVVNELMFAYSTDTGCLNTYMGYSVSPYSTSFVAEFEYAAQYAISKGVGTYVVCPSDYGWHVIYVSFVYDENGEVYGFNWDERETEGTFSNLYYEYLKTTPAETYANMAQTEAIAKYNTDTCVTKYTKRYKDLLSIEA